VCICIHSYTAYKAHASYCHLWPARLYHIFFHIISLKNLNTKLCFGFFYKFCLKYFSFWEELSEMWSYMYTHRSACKVPVILARLEWNSNFSPQIFAKYSNIKFHTNRAVGAELFHADRRTDRHDEADSRFSKFCECA